MINNVSSLKTSLVINPSINHILVIHLNVCSIKFVAN